MITNSAGGFENLSPQRFKAASFWGDCASKPRVSGNFMLSHRFLQPGAMQVKPLSRFAIAARDKLWFRPARRSFVFCIQVPGLQKYCQHFDKPAYLVGFTRIPCKSARIPCKLYQQINHSSSFHHLHQRFRQYANV